MRTSLRLTKYILEILNQNTKIKKIVKDRIYPIDAQLGTKFPFLVILRTSLSCASNKDGRYQDTVYFSVIVMDDNYKGSVELSTVVDDALDHMSYRTEEIQISGIYLENVDETMFATADGNKYVQNMQFRAIIENFN